MPTNNKTANLNLNSWLPTDKPKRDDFVSDNTILDAIISAHLNDTDVHMTDEDRGMFKSLYEFGTIPGTGEDSTTYTFDFEPKCVIVFLKGSPLLKYDSTNNYTICNCGIAFNKGYGSSLGISLSGNTVTLNQSTSASNGGYANLNTFFGQYAYIAFK